MRIKLLAILFLGMFTLVSCSKDEKVTDCDLTNLEEVAVGSWKGSKLGNTFKLKLNADGSYTGNVYEFSLNNQVYNPKSYTITGNTLTLTNETSGGAKSSSKFSINAKDCNTLKLGIMGITVDMKRQ